jgi:GAF domain-containing protein
MLLQPMLQRLMAAHELREILEVALRDVIALHGAERGNIQLVAPDGNLVIVAQRNLSLAFLSTFRRVAHGSGSVCERAMGSDEIVFVADVEEDRAFAPYLALARAEPFRSVLSTPLRTSQHELIGVLSVQSASRFTPTPLELDSIRRYSERLADAIAASCTTGLPHVAERLAEEVMAAAQQPGAGTRR